MTNPYIMLRINEEIRRKKQEYDVNKIKLDIEKCKSICRYIAGYKCWKENDIKKCYNKCNNNIKIVDVYNN